jgi:hypothetical protein
LNGDHIRYLPAAMTKEMVDGGHADVANANGKVKSIRLITAASGYARMIGPANRRLGSTALRGPRKAGRWIRRVEAPLAGDRLRVSKSRAEPDAFF